MDFFSLFVFGEKGLKIWFDDVLGRKETFFYTIKTRFFNVSKMAFFQRG